MDEDKLILDEIQQKKGKRNLQSILNKSKFSSVELDEVMMEA